ncbi:MAG: nicotinate-nucleotide--dimethylbenzimidazole phosphoribosyltransferase [Nitriliruptorales bacterium]|nr:nicotinate-nucleotide--dimethylbenzimidazole phosphoribosyltransferase [Nitriliruptorales bacterium]
MSLEARVHELAAEITPVDSAAAEQARQRHDRLLKPPGSLGAVEALGARLAAIGGRCPPPVPADPAVVVAAADHGVHARGVTRWPQAVTAAMVASFCAGTAAVNAIAGAVGARVSVLDVGIAAEVGDHPRLADGSVRKRGSLTRAPVRAGTADLSTGPAMTREEAAAALLAGAGMAKELLGGGADLLVLGDMGIANTTSAACLVAAFTGQGPADVTGRGAGSDDDTLARKTAVVAKALALHRPDPTDPLGVLAAMGGLEHAAAAGVSLAGAVEGVPVVLDGVSAGAAALVAVGLAPAVLGYLIAGHRSTEPGASAALERLGLEPVLDLGLRLGEGTGGLLAVPVVIAAARVLTEMGTLEDLATPSGTTTDFA